MLSNAATSGTGCRDVQAEVAALSLACSREATVTSVDTKLADAWLGFYVALTKSSLKSAASVTQASTEAATEGSGSEVESSGGPSPRRTLGSAVKEKRASWADVTEDVNEDAASEAAVKKRTRRSRRRRTRGRGKKNRKLAAEAALAEECSAIDESEGEKDDLDDSDRQQAVVTASTPALATLPVPVRTNSTKTTLDLASSTLPAGVSAVTPCLDTQPILSLHGFASPVTTRERPTGHLGGYSCSPFAASTTTPSPGFMTSTSPKSTQSLSMLDASARTPARPGGFGSPVARMMPTTPSFGSLTYQGGHAEYHGSHLLSSPPPHTMPVVPMPAPALLGTSAPSMVNQWTPSGMNVANHELAMQLLAAAPEVYED